MKKIIAALSMLALSTTLVLADTITASQIAAGVASNKTELEQETWWTTNMAGKVHQITGLVTDVESGTFSGYWVSLEIGDDITVRCGLGNEYREKVSSLRKGARFTCAGPVDNTWIDIFGVMFQMESP